MAEELVTIEKWKYGKIFAYSVTYDEAFEDLLENTLPIHQKFGIPGNISALVGQIGQIRNMPQSSYHGKFRHMDVDQMKYLMSLGWSVSCHSMTHGLMWENTYMEVVESKHKLEDLLGVPVTAFIVPNTNEHHPVVVPYAKRAGYLSVYTVTDALNNYDTDRYALNRTPLVEQHFSPFFRKYDHYNRLHEALEYRGWIVEYTHLTNLTVLSPHKEISQAGLIRRFEKLEEVAKEHYWAAIPEEVVDYMIVHKATSVQVVDKSSSKIKFKVAQKGIPPQVQNKELTFRCELPSKRKGVKILIDGKEFDQSGKNVHFETREVLLTLPAVNGMSVELVCSAE